jgi:hypothetical protein
MDVFPVIRRIPRRLLEAAIAVLLSCAIISCGHQSSQPESPEFTPDERYLIDAYVQIKRARGYYPYQAAVAESLFAGLSATIDTVRIARTITALNTTPDRWARVYREIEDRMRQSAKEKSLERAGAGARTPAQVEQHDERH